MKRKIAVFLKGYPRLSETFIAQEIRNLEKAGLDLQLVSLRHPTDSKQHPIHHEIEAPILYLPEYVHNEPRRCLKAWWKARRLRGYRQTFLIWLGDLKRDFTRNRFRRFAQALVAATELDTDIDFLYGHFIHTPGSVTRYCALMRELPFSISAHAKDIWTSPDWELSEKLNDAEWTVTCTSGGVAHLKRLASKDEKVRLVYHGLDLDRFPEPVAPPSMRDGSNSDSPVRFLSVGRAVEKKGLDTLLQALAMIPEHIHWTWTHIAGGPLLADLKKLGVELGISDRLTFLGSQSQSRVLQAYRESELFVLPCRIAADGDRDGLPNVIVEAQSQQLAVVSSPISGIPELIEDGINGALVDPDNPEALAIMLAQLAADPSKRSEMGLAGMHRVRQEFDASKEIDLLLQLFDVRP